ncbi:MAG TPA: hypothetical protein VES20_04065 [Bryobacteraceae bacterium]|nr:hypothetical protein [Bryobacteraceae bacterium]
MNESVTTTHHDLIAPGQDFEQWTVSAFVTALLLTGSVEHAEAIVLKAIRVSDIGRASSERLLTSVIAVAVNSRPRFAERAQTVTSRSSILSWELNSVIYLSRKLRQCFVLRFLLGWSREATARMLCLDPRVVDERTKAAAVRLTLMRQVFGPPVVRNPIACFEFGNCLGDHCTTDPNCDRTQR